MKRRIRTRFIIPRGAFPFIINCYDDNSFKVIMRYGHSYSVTPDGINIWENRGNFTEIPAREAVLMPEFDAVRNF